MNSQTAIDISDLEDLSDWGIVPLLSLDQAALLWGGIDPVGYSLFEKAKDFEHPEKYRKAHIAMQAFLGGIVLRTLTVHELWITNWNGEVCRIDQKADNFTKEDISTAHTLVMRDVIVEWARRERCTTLRQDLMKKVGSHTPAIHPPKKQPLQVEYRPLEPTYETPEFDVACTVIKDKWNAVPSDGIPPKEAEMQEYIRTILREKTGKEPSAAAVNRVDTLTRPERFKNRKTQK